MAGRRRASNVTAADPNTLWLIDISKYWTCECLLPVRAADAPALSREVERGIRRAVKARGHFPTEQAALKCIYLALTGCGPNRPRQATLDESLEETAQCLP